MRRTCQCRSDDKKEELIVDKLFGFLNLNWRFELTKFKPVRKLFKSRWFPLLLIIFCLFMFMIILISEFIGGYSSGSYNFGVMMVWILWWVMLMFILVPFFARVFCMVCPFPFFSDWFQRKRIFMVNTGKQAGLNLKWPKSLKNMWVMNIAFLVTTFFSGYFTVRPYASFVLLSLIIVLAFLMGLVFKKRTFCLYMCPVSGFQGLYAQFATSEIRRIDPEVCKGHKPKTCFVGNEAGYGCPWHRTPFDFEKNTYCGMCLECFKSCPHDNMGFFLRPPGTDLLVDSPKEPKGLDEAYKAFIMLGIAVMFYSAFQGPWGWLKDMVRGTTLTGWLTYITMHSTFSLVVIPGIFAIFAGLAKKLSGNKDIPFKKIFVHSAYTLIPMGLGVWISFSIGIILPNGSYILHILSDPFAWGWNLFGTVHVEWTPMLTGWIGYLQGAALLLFYVFSLEYGYKIAQRLFPDKKQAVRGWIPIMAFLTLVTLVFLWLFIGS